MAGILAGGAQKKIVKFSKGLVPVVLRQVHVRRREARFVKVVPAMGGHWVMLCNQASEFGPKLKQILDLIRTILAERGLFTCAVGCVRI
jgi:hypothetical protein